MRYAVLLVLSLVAFRSEDLGLDERARELLRARLEAAGIPAYLEVGGDRLYTASTLPLFYQQRGFDLAWSVQGEPLATARQLISALQNVSDEGLQPGGYHEETIETLLVQVIDQLEGRQAPDPRLLVDLDLVLTDAFLVCAAHLLAGRVDPVSIDAEWHASRREADLAALLEEAVGSRDVTSALDSVKPQQKEYQRLKAALIRYRVAAEAGGWPLLPSDVTYEEGLTGQPVVRLVRRLKSTGDLDPGVAADSLDARVIDGIRHFQLRHGLDADGVVGPRTLAALNTPVQERIRQLEVNLERWRWMPHDLGKKHILVNIAGFELDFVENGASKLNMRVIVGRQYRRTPVFSGLMTYVVLAPTWHVTQNIAVNDKLPEIRRDPSYLQKQRMRVMSGWGSDAKEIDPASVDWSSVSARSFPYRLRQDPGPNNALGRVKFMFPNSHNVYLHDTPSRELFAKAERIFSSGCIRLEKPLELAETVLALNEGWTRERIEATINRWQEQTVILAEPVPVHLQYWTAWANEDGTIHFRNDVYDRDGRLYTALREPA